jgi:hypothetical protein
MLKCSLLIASCFLFGSPLTAGPIPTLAITSLTASASGAFGPIVSVSASGPSVSIEGSATGTAHTPFGDIPIGSPIGGWEFSFPPPSPQCCPGVAGMITTGGTRTFVALNGGFGVLGGTTNLFVPDGSPFPATVSGEFLAYACPSGNLFMPGCIGLPAIADIVIDLPGAMRVGFTGPNFSGDFTVDGLSFTSVSVPESSSMLLVLFGALAILIGSMRPTNAVCLGHYEEAQSANFSAIVNAWQFLRETNSPAA